MRKVTKVEPSMRIPQQSPPVMRSVAKAVIANNGGIEVCDNDHNTDTERDVFFVKIS